MNVALPIAEPPAVPRGSRPLSEQDLPGDEEFARNLVAGRWEFPAAPYEYEIRNPIDSTVTTVVPLSSRFDVERAVEVAREAGPAWTSDPAHRIAVISRLADELERLSPEVAALTTLEAGIAEPDAQYEVTAVVQLIRTWLAGPPPAPRQGVAGVILSWGGPLTEAVTAVVPLLLAGHTVVVKPSLRGPLAAVVLAHLASRSGLPAGVLGVLQGTGVDVGAALQGTAGLIGLHVRAGERTLGLAARSSRRTGVPLLPLRSGGGLLWSGRDADPSLVAALAARALRLHEHAGPGAVPLLVVHAETAGSVVDAVLAAAESVRPAPLPTEPLRRRALDRMARIMAGGGRLLTGGQVPDDIPHRMGWLVPSTVLTVGAVNNGNGPASAADVLAGPAGPVLAVATWRSAADLAGSFAAPRFADGIAQVVGIDDDELAEAALPHVVLPRDQVNASASATALPTSWTAGIRLGGPA